MSVPQEQSRSSLQPRTFGSPAQVWPFALLLLFAWPLDVLNYDSTRDLLIARDCSALSMCAGQGPTTSVPGLVQGVRGMIS